MKEEAELNMSAAEAQAAWAETVAGANAVLDEMNALIDTTNEATIAATDAVTDGGAAFDLYTEAGRFANDAMIDVAKSGWDVIEASREQGATTDELRAKTQTARDEFIRQATQLGLTSDAANRLADEYGLIPGEVATTAKFDADTAKANLSDYERRLAALPTSKSVTIYQSIVPTSAESYPAPLKKNSGGQTPGAASGTYVTGPGSDIDDRVPAMLSPGEFVLDKQAVDQIGVGNLFAKNEGIGRTGGADIATAVAAGVRDALANLPLTLQVEGQQMSAFIRPVAAGEVRAFEQTRRRVAR